MSLSSMTRSCAEMPEALAICAAFLKSASRMRLASSAAPTRLIRSSPGFGRRTARTGESPSSWHAHDGERIAFDNQWGRTAKEVKQYPDARALVEVDEALEPLKGVLLVDDLDPLAFLQ